MTGNTEFTIKLNPLIYSLDVIYSACYIMLEKAYFLIDGDPSKEIIVYITPRPKFESNSIKSEFLDELINYADYISRSNKTRKIRETLLQRAMITNDPNYVQKITAEK